MQHKFDFGRHARIASISGRTLSAKLEARLKILDKKVDSIHAKIRKAYMRRRDKSLQKLVNLRIFYCAKRHQCLVTIDNLLFEGTPTPKLIEEGNESVPEGDGGQNLNAAKTGRKDLHTSPESCLNIFNFCPPVNSSVSHGGSKNRLIIPAVQHCRLRATSDCDRDKKSGIDENRCAGGTNKQHNSKFVPKRVPLSELAMSSNAAENSCAEGMKKPHGDVPVQKHVPLGEAQLVSDALESMSL